VGFSILELGIHDRLTIDRRIMGPVLSPENIYAHPHQEQDVILWYNRALWHSIVSVFFLSYPEKQILTDHRPSSPSLTDQGSCISVTSQHRTTLRCRKMPHNAC
jgi:hypothetical protein